MVVDPTLQLVLPKICQRRREDMVGNRTITRHVVRFALLALIAIGFDLQRAKEVEACQYIVECGEFTLDNCSTQSELTCQQVCAQMDGEEFDPGDCQMRTGDYCCPPNQPCCFNPPYSCDPFLCSCYAWVECPPWECGI